MVRDEQEYDETPIDCLALLPTHPYCANFKAPAYLRADGQWRVKWHDFESVPQDELFKTEQEAVDFSLRLELEVRSGFVAECWGTSAAEMDAFWKWIYRVKD